MIGEPLFDADSIARRVAEIGAAISRDYAGKLPLMIGLLSAASVFLADLARAVTIPCHLDFISLSEYGDAAATGSRWTRTRLSLWRGVTSSWWTTRWIRG